MISRHWVAGLISMLAGFKKISAWAQAHRSAVWAAIVVVAGGVFTVVQFAGSATQVFPVLWNWISGREPVTVTLVEGDIRPLDGFPAIEDKEYGKVLTGGGKARFFVQANSPDEIVTVNQLRLNVEKLADPQPDRFKYEIDPNKQPGLGSPEVHRYYVTFSGATGTISYVTDTDETLLSTYPDLLAQNPPRVLTLDRSAGLQEAVDLVMRPSQKGLYKVEVEAHFIADGRPHEVKSAPIYIYRD